jgi:3-hydroxybutyryl-CoA dehydratase
VIAPERWIDGTALPSVRRRISQHKINLYAEASGDHNPIHVDKDYAARTPLGGTVAHGMMILAYASQMLTEAFGQWWLKGGRLDVRFKKPARPGDMVTVRGQIFGLPKKTNGRSWIGCRFWCENQENENLIVGDAFVPVPQEVLEG